ncbi:MAG: hypothetical protein JWM82_4294 [Myxococcales bacterium]|nr:hypothetical protein [Myxococcales bacterium]
MRHSLRWSRSRWLRGATAIAASTFVVFVVIGAFSAAALAAHRTKATKTEVRDDARGAPPDADVPPESTKVEKAEKSEEEKGSEALEAKPKEDASEAATADAAKAAEAPKPVEAPKPEAAKVVAPPPLLAGEPGWQFGFFGWAELDTMWDSTQSFTESVLNSPISRPHTIAGDNPRFQATGKDSRLGFKATAPPFNGMKASAYMESDFFGIIPTTASQDQSYTYASIRLRQYYAKLETPVLDILAGQTFDLFGWGAGGFFPNTPAFLGVMGEVFHRNVQLRLSKVLGGPADAASFEIAVAGVRGATRDSGIPDAQAGLKLSLNSWQGASAQGPRPAKRAPASLGVSAVGRRMAVSDFEAITADPQMVNGWGAAADLFLPIIPASGDDLSNALSVTAEYSRSSGVSDLYLTLTGGVLFPSLPNPHNVLPAPAYTPNIDNGIVTFDAQGMAHAINWQGLMVNAHYHLPIRQGKALSLSGTYSQISSNNAMALTPVQGRNFVWDKGHYIDGTLWWRITPAFQMSVSYQQMTQIYGDDRTKATNHRGEASWWFFF